MTQADAHTLSAADAFIARWQSVGASELSTSQSFLIDLCRLLEVDVPHATPEQNYMFERPITFAHGDGSTSAGRIDLYRRGAFVLESKKIRQGRHTKGFDDALLRARSQAESYARALPSAEGRPPFLIVVDVGQRLELYSEFSRSGATYVPFPDPRSHRIALDDLRRLEIRERLRRVWLEPLSLDPSRESARVTRDIANRLAKLARSLEQAGHAPETAAQFLMRCLFTMFAEDVRLLPDDAFRNLLGKHREAPATAMRMLAQLWRDMDAGGFSAVIAGDVLRFNGKLFKQPDVLPLDTSQMDLLIEAASANWRHVEPAIFGTLLERALSPKDRHKLGAHYTPRAYVERLVLPAVIEPLRLEWSNAQAAAGTLAQEGKTDDAVHELLRFHHRLCNVRVLDPACGSGNFLYVTLEHLKRLEGEVLNALDELGHRQTGLALGGERADAASGETVDPHNLLGIELNPRAAAIAEVVLWIGYLQWHFRTRGDVNPPTPVIRDFRNIESRDAVLAYDRVELVTDAHGRPVTRWDGETMKVSPVTGELVPDETARMSLENYVNPRKAAWPQADFVIGNPPFIGNKRMRTALGDGYVEALRDAWPEVPGTADLVLYWWHHAAALVRNGSLLRFGLITTNSIRQVQGRQTTEPHLSAKKNPLKLVAAVPDHPWVDGADGASVRISMTVGALCAEQGTLYEVIAEEAGEDGEIVSTSSRLGQILPDLRIGANVAGASALTANADICFQGYILRGEGFILSAEQERSMLADNSNTASILKRWKNGRDFAQSTRGHAVIDMWGMSEAEAMEQHPSAYQHLLHTVKPFRDQVPERKDRENWWTWCRARPELRHASKGLTRVIATNFAAKHRFFVFEPTTVALDHNTYLICADDAALHGVLSSSTHLVWMLAAGGTLEDRPTWTNSTCFEPFPFPDLHAADKFGRPVDIGLVSSDGTTGRTETYGEYPSDRIRNLAEQLDAHRKRQQAVHPGLALTGMYNVLEKLRSGEPLTAKERVIHEQGLVSVLRQLHDELDEAVLYAYGWGDLLPLLRVAHGNEAPAEDSTREDASRAFDEVVLERLVALNAQRAAEEARGLVRWLRPEFQDPAAGRAPEQQDLEAGEPDTTDEAVATAAAIKPAPWPKGTVDQVRAVADVLVASPVPMTLDEVAARFTARGPWKRRLPRIIEMLVVLGRAKNEDGRFNGI
ncbi:class I SAM-dependent DNA methyltransferase [Xanthomonas citri pv. eucalyptorum]|nr:class I SAM-dependent DNA methyltransferase [Xanthomonas axonopodis pv. eucalyptorum]